jgi:hypothetical protein
MGGRIWEMDINKCKSNSYVTLASDGRAGQGNKGDNKQTQQIQSVSRIQAFMAP